MKFISIVIACLANIVIGHSAHCQTLDNSETKKKSVFRLAVINGRTWLTTPDGKPFFAHGITHTGNPKLKADYEAVSKACKDLGFNSYGYGCPMQLKKDMPYVEGRNFVPISTYRGSGSFRFVDIFNPKEQEKLAQQVKECCVQNRGNPNLIGYFWTDLAAWPLKNSVGENWVTFTRNLPVESPGRKAYAEFLKTWSGEDEEKRELAFLRVIAGEYFRVMGEANRKHDPDHLVFGDRFAFNTLVPEVLEEMLPWVDAVAIQPPFQPGFPKAKYQEIYELTQKPILICDFAIRFKDGDKSIRGWKPQENAQTAGVHYSKYIRAALETPYIIGAFWCNPVDSKPAFNKTGIKQGMFDDGLKPRPGLGEIVLELNRHITKVTSDGKVPPTSASTPKTDPETPAEMFLSLKLTAEQQVKLEALEKDRKAAEAKFRDLKGQTLRDARDRFYAERKKKLQQIFTQEQWDIWSRFWQRTNRK